MRFDFSTASQITFGPGTLKEIGKLARPFGRRALVVTGSDPTRAATLLTLLGAEGISAETFPVAHEPSVDVVTEAVATARRMNCEFLIGFGGGSVIDCAKAVAGLVTNPGEPLDFLEVVGAGRPLTIPALPWIAIPTTAGTGAEVTRNAVLAVPEKRVKVSLRSPFLLARLAVVDPELTYSLPPTVTAASGMDALTQLIEAYVCSRTNPLVDALCARGVPLAARALEQVSEDPARTPAREALSLAALWSGIALANAGLGAVHGLAGPIGGLFPAPHGAVCAALLAPVMRANIGALRARAPEHSSLTRFAEIAEWLTGSPQVDPEAGVRHVEMLVSRLRIPQLSAYGLTPPVIPEVVAQSQRASSMKANPLPLTDYELATALRSAL